MQKDMTRRLKYFLSTVVIVSVLVFQFLPSIALAHELLPKVLTEYLSQNPDATPEEIQEFIRLEAPNFAEKYQDKDKVLELIRGQNTNFFDNAYDFIKFGIEHILIGLDHILFVLSLLLVYVSVREILRLTIAFTFAHSITLLVAGSGLLVLSPKIVEPIIALSIAFVALTSVFFKDNKYLGNIKSKTTMVFIFGLFHGLGFAGLLEEIHLPKDKFISSLLSFNIGIELGQILIILIALPFIYLFRDKKMYPVIIKIIAVAMSVLSVFWVIQRIFF